MALTKPAERAGQSFKFLFDQRLEQLVLAPEIQINGAYCAADTIGQFTHREALVAIAIEQVTSAFKDAGASCCFELWDIFVGFAMNDVHIEQSSMILNYVHQSSRKWDKKIDELCSVNDKPRLLLAELLLSGCVPGAVSLVGSIGKKGTSDAFESFHILIKQLLPIR